MNKTYQPLRPELKLSLSYEPPLPPPPSGAVWEDELDYPGVVAEVTLPKDLVNGLLIPECQCQATCCGEPLHQAWGDECETGRVISKVFRAATLSVAEGEARLWHSEGQATLNHVLDLRAVRLLRRAATIEGAHMVCGEVLPEVTP